ncbi:MAG: VacJ family lipoprotein [Acetobacter sp.]|nr:VacJ family lipoprotein [Acetobacter sp.]
MSKGFSKYFIALLLFSLSGCTTVTSRDTPEEITALESYNRAMFGFNDKLDKYVIRPVAKGYRAVTNEFIRERVSNFFYNIEEPVSAVNHILQGELGDSGNNLGRFVLNTTLGGVGLFDVASKVGLERKKTGFDETLATWCVPDGPFLILPVVGPSTPRAATGFVVDGYSSPMYWVAQESNGEDAWAVYYGAAGVKYLNLMAENLKMLESLEEGSVDYYEAVKSMYLQNRGKIKRCGGAESTEQTSEYDFDMDNED